MASQCLTECRASFALGPGEGEMGRKGETIWFSFQLKKVGNEFHFEMIFYVRAKKAAVILRCPIRATVPSSVYHMNCFKVFHIFE